LKNNRTKKVDVFAARPFRFSQKKSFAALSVPMNPTEKISAISQLAVQKPAMAPAAMTMAIKIMNHFMILFLLTKRTRDLL